MEVLLALVIFFKQAAAYFGNDRQMAEILGGNLDPLFLLGIFGLYYILRNNKIASYLVIVLPIIIVAILQIIFIDKIELIGLTVNTAKIMLCAAIFIFVSHLRNTINFAKVSSVFSLIAGAFAILAFILPRTTLLWTVNDGINLFDQERLKLFFLEPSELGFILVISSYFLIRALRSTDIYKQRVFYFVCLLINFFILLAAKPLGAISLGIIGLAIGLIYYLIIKKKGMRPKFWAISIAASIFLIGVGLTARDSPLMHIDNSIVQRAIYITSGSDGSVNYRTNVSYDVANDAFFRSPWLGHGMGYTSSESFIEYYEDIGLRTQIVNSYLAFIVETGAIGLLVIFILLYTLLKSALLSKSSMIVSLTMFIIMYHFTGGYFTNPLVWALYGFIVGASYSRAAHISKCANLSGADDV